MTQRCGRGRDGVPGTVATQEPGELKVGEPDGWDERANCRARRKKDEVNLQMSSGRHSGTWWNERAAILLPGLGSSGE